MSDFAIVMEGIGKRYHVGHHSAPRERYTALRDVMARNARALVRRSAGLLRGSSVKSEPRRDREFWALKDISLNVNRGEVLGIIGRNGAGKSTLLKVLSRITEPTEGRAVIRGRVASLLEVGTGFHPELTGRDNIFLNGAILGMTKKEIRAKFDEIVHFAETETFLDTPVKHYSSGMYVRLAFAVAAHLETEVLIVDEVLAVGDAHFQNKCLGRMKEVASGQGRTVLFVSHNMSAMVGLCENGVLLEKGHLVAKDQIGKIVREYSASQIDTSRTELSERSDRWGDGEARLTYVNIKGDGHEGNIESNSRLRISIGYKSSKTLRNTRLMIGVYDFSNTCIYFLDSDAFGPLQTELPAEGEINCLTNSINLTPGLCYVNVALCTGPVWQDYIRSAATFEIIPSEKSVRSVSRSDALCLLEHEWWV